MYLIFLGYGSIIERLKASPEKMQWRLEVGRARFLQYLQRDAGHKMRASFSSSFVVLLVVVGVINAFVVVVPTSQNIRSSSSSLDKEVVV